jgi:hypothetical protein
LSGSWRKNVPRKALDFGGRNSRPANWFAPPGGNRSRLFLSNEKAQFSGDFPASGDQPGGTSSFAVGWA